MPDGPQHHKLSGIISVTCVRNRLTEVFFSLVNIHHTLAGMCKAPLCHSNTEHLLLFEKGLWQRRVCHADFLRWDRVDVSWVLWCWLKSPLTSFDPQYKYRCPLRCTSPACLTVTPQPSFISTGAPPADQQAPSTWSTAGSMQQRYTKHLLLHTHNVEDSCAG